jgi:hypothetical protein
MIKNIVRKIAPSLYLSLAHLKVELWDGFKEVKQLAGLKNCCFLSLFWAYLYHGASPQEYVCLGFARLNSLGRKDYVTIRRNRKLNHKFNDTDANKILWDKGLFNKHFSEFVHRKYLTLNKKTTDAEIQNFFDSLSYKRYVVKPNDLYYGRGVYVADSLDELKKIKSSGKNYIIEEVVQNDPPLAKLNKSSLNTFRVVTCIDRIGEVHIVAILLRTGREGAVIDNLLGGGTCYHVDVETGIIDGVGKDGWGNSFLKHPTSGIVMPGFQISRIDEVKHFAVKLAKHLPKARYVGWDIALTPNGIEIIEGNVCPSAELIQCNGIGLLKEIESFF